jgi:hypothetical protein
VGDVLDTPDATDFNDCVNICSSHHPRCDGVTFNGKKCFLKGNIQPDKTRPAGFFDGAAALFPPASSNCGSLGSSAAVSGTNFGIFCGIKNSGAEISQAFASTFQDCMTQCSTTSGCGGVSYEAAMTQGFNNCYLKKSSVGAGDNASTSGFDTAILQANAAAAGGGSSAAQSVVPSTITPVVKTTPPPLPITQTITSVVTSVSLAAGNVSVTELLTVPYTTVFSSTEDAVPSATDGAAGSTQGTDSGSGSGDGMSRAWIAAPVVGSAAAIVIIAVLFVFLKRRKRAASIREGKSRELHSSGGDSAVSSSASTQMSPRTTNLLSSWLPGPGQIKRSLGNFASASAKRGPPPPLALPRPSSSSLSSMSGANRPDVYGYWVGDKLEDIQEKSGAEGDEEGEPSDKRASDKGELRRSRNGLSMNSW